MQQLFRQLIDRVPLLRRLSGQGAFPPGHYYSPVPSEQDIEDYLQGRLAPEAVREVPGVDLDETGQRELLLEFAAFYREQPFSERPSSERRYHLDNGWFAHSDGIFLHCFLRKIQPRRVIEIGSGFSSAVMLDTADACFSQWPKFTFVEPYPDRLQALLRAEDWKRIQHLETGVQKVAMATFEALEAGDLLFIDSSHVVKCGSDLQFLLLEVLPRLRKGVFVHFHDVFFPFDYPTKWLREGR